MGPDLGKVRGRGHLDVPYPKSRPALRFIGAQSTCAAPLARHLSISRDWGDMPAFFLHKRVRPKEGRNNMRSSWEDGGKADLDEPASITERQLRSLRRGARAGAWAMLLALVSVVAAGWSLLMGPDALAGIEGVQLAKMKVLSAIGQPAPKENEGAPAPPPPPAPTQEGGMQGASTPDSSAAAPGTSPSATGR